MEIEDIEINELNPISGKKKEILIGIAAILILIGLVYGVLQFMKPNDLNVYFTDAKIRPGASTELVVEFRNNTPEDLHNVLFRITPENTNILVGKAEHVEPIIGSGSYRKLEIPVTVLGNLTEGTYKINILVDAGEKEYNTNVYLEITK